MLLYRPVGLRELELIAANGFRAFPPRLAWQPIFYPVLTLEYARFIAKEWNTPDEASGFAGFVTRFEIDDDYGAQFTVQKVGDRTALELWIPAAELETFNQHIVSGIEVIESYYGDRFVGQREDL